MIDDGMANEARLEQPMNNPRGISVTDDGMLMEDIWLQFANVSGPKVVNELPKVTDIKFKQLLNAL